ncbi:MAG: hypothetical protein GWN67_10720 [Phycisphaerae bacterium]|nr:cytochrome c [Phycisphaerae bacterium]NIP52596.1 cytochrome c [Phycisphaerae bacterium]NIS51580.1 cytochrome c [Phycisphaerae bacterium]NIU09165.1 cytochrome c [Phycisphaerae bacterium]NIU56829.1 hypothetical protein [Phycisphaerae bacterium]
MERKLLHWWFVAIGLLVLIYGCQTISREMSPGEMLYRAKCSSCHSVIATSSYDRQEWRLYIDKYGKKMTDDEKRIVLEYLVKPD